MQDDKKASEEFFERIKPMPLKATLIMILVVGSLLVAGVVAVVLLSK